MTHAQKLKSGLQKMLAHNEDGHLDISETLLLREVMEFLDHPIMNQSAEISKEMLQLAAQLRNQ